MSLEEGVAEIVAGDVDGEFVIQWPQPLLDQLGWACGDVLVWRVQDDGIVTVEKVS